MVVNENKAQLENIERISQKLFNKPSKDIKYCLVTNFVHFNLLEEGLVRTGLYSWQNVFKGDVKFPNNITDWKQYDIFQVNLSGQDYFIPDEIRDKIGTNTSQKIVANNDYTVELWQNSFMYPKAMRRQLQSPDMIFGTEFNQTRTLELLAKRKVHEIPHPTYVKRLKALKGIVPENTISVFWHRYDNYGVYPSLAVEDLGLKTRLIGYDKDSDPKRYVTSTCYDDIAFSTNNLEFIKQIKSSKVCYEPFSITSYGRCTVDSAALGVPTVGSVRVGSMRKCFPFTCCEPYDIKTARELIKKVLTDTEFREKVINYALEASEFYNLENSKERFLIALEEGSPKVEI